MDIRKVPFILFLIGILLIGYYGFVLSILAVLLQVIIVRSSWRKIPALKQTKKFNDALYWLISGSILFGVGVYGYFYWSNGLFGSNHDSTNLLIWGVIGGVPFLIGSINMFRLSTKVKAKV